MYLDVEPSLDVSRVVILAATNSNTILVFSRQIVFESYCFQELKFIVTPEYKNKAMSSYLILNKWPLTYDS